MSIDVRPIVCRLLRGLPAQWYCSIAHLMYHGRLSTFRNPQTFSELLYAKMIWDHDPRYPLTVDKFTVREWVAERAGEELLIPLLAVDSDPEAIDFDAIEPPFVVKATHGYNMTLMVREGDQVDKSAIVATAHEWLKRDFYGTWKEWAYKDCPRRIVVEKFIGDGVRPPADLKFYVFRGRVGIIGVESDRWGDHKTNYFDRNWRPLNIRITFPPVIPAPPKPDNFERLLEIAENLGSEFDFVRIDLYEVDGQIYFGEITHYPGGGLIRFRTAHVDAAIGELWRKGTPLPEDVYWDDDIPVANP